MRRRRERGFTLVEVLVALVILGLVMGACYRLLSTGLRSVSESATLMRAVTLAQSVLADAEQRSDPRAAAASRTIDGFRCDVRVTPEEEPAVAGPADTGLRLYRMTVTVAWGLSGRYRLDTLALGPAL